MFAFRKEWSPAARLSAMAFPGGAAGASGASASAPPRLVPVPGPEIQELMLAAAQYTEMASSLRQKNELDRAIRTMERAVGMCTKAEYHHPAMAVETARARINLAATLSEAKRHRAALMAIKKAQGTLQRVLTWADDCVEGREDPAVRSIGEEARTLRCAALVAESIQMELCPGPTVDVVSGGYDAQLAPLSPSQSQVLPQIKREKKPPAGAAAVPTGAGTGAEQGRARRAGPAESQRPAPVKVNLRPRVVEERTDVFSEFLRNVEAERVARLGALNDNWEDQAKRRLGQVHRRTQLALDLMGDEELKEKRYTNTGHQVFMKAMKKANKCWSDPILVHEAAKEKATPEICQIRKLNRRLYVKPPTPPPVQPPKPKVDQALASNLRSNHARSSIKAEH